MLYGECVGRGISEIKVTSDAINQSIKKQSGNRQVDWTQAQPRSGSRSRPRSSPIPSPGRCQRCPQQRDWSERPALRHVTRKMGDSLSGVYRGAQQCVWLMLFNALLTAPLSEVCAQDVCGGWRVCATRTWQTTSTATTEGKVKVLKAWLFSGQYCQREKVISIKCLGVCDFIRFLNDYPEAPIYY